MKEYKIYQISYKETYPWLKHKHYAKRIPSISYSFGLFKGNILVGVITFGLPSSHDLCLFLGEKYKNNFLELNRLCVNDGLVKNSLSFFVSQSLRMISRPKVIVSYADTEQNHCGYIYQATNWIYTGLTKKQYDLKIKGTNKHSRHVYDNKKLETEKVNRTQKHRYFMFLGNKKEKKEMLDLLPVKILPYPKTINKRYDTNFEPQTQQILF